MTFPDLLDHDAEIGGELDAALEDVDAVCGFIARRRAALVERIETAGALLLRGFPVRSAQDFDACVEAFSLGRFSYRDSLSNAVRVDLTDRVFTANEAPPDATIRPHHELAQTPAHPRHLFFFCEQPAESGGATALVRSDRVWEALERTRPDFAESLAREGVVYHHVMPGEDDPDSAIGRSWRGTLSVSSRAEAEEKLRALGYAWSWQEDDALAVTSPRLPARLEATHGRPCFFNQLVATRSWSDARNDPATAARLGGGGAIPLVLRNEIAALTDRLAVDLDWQAGDLAILDNHLVQHGRRPFEGTRRVLVAFSARAETGPPRAAR